MLCLLLFGGGRGEWRGLNNWIGVWGSTKQMSGVRTLRNLLRSTVRSCSGLYIDCLGCG